jgi:ribonuclease HI
MPKFTCTICNGGFQVPQPVLDKYPGWQPKYCREHSPTRKRTSGSGAKAKRRTSKRRSSRSEENLTLAEVLAKYTDGPDSGVFTDGSANPNPGPGGWGMVWVAHGEIVSQSHGHQADTTNNRMELTALIEAYRTLPRDAEVTVHSDSRLCIDTITKWAPNWERKTRSRTWTWSRSFWPSTGRIPNASWSG